MAKMNGIYKCNKCGNIVHVVHEGGGDLACCGEDMQHMAENTVDAAVEKHVPVIEKTGNGYKVTVGSVAHPMDDDHYIEWIELVADGVSYRAYLNPGGTPEAEFCISASTVSAREYCNKHGVWASK